MQQLLTGLSAATVDSALSNYGLVNDAAIAIEDGIIRWCGPQTDTPAAFRQWPERSLEGRLVTPAFIDCHTHIVHGGNRAGEFAARLEGESYEAIAKAGGGIVSTVLATRQLSDEKLLEEALPRIDALLKEGVQTIEVKSGYGLDMDTEIKMLRVARKIEQVRPVRVLTTFLGAHAVPPEYKEQPDHYIDQVCIPTLIEAHRQGLVDAVDGFCEHIAFSAAQIKRVFDTAQSLGLPVKLHAEQLSNSGGAVLAAESGALSVDHLEYLDENGVLAMQQSGSVAVLLPGAFYTLRESRVPPVEELRRLGVPIALASDCNPGSSPMTSLLLAMNMGCTLFRLTPEEALLGVTRHAAAALDLQSAGQIKPGYKAELSVWNIDNPAELSYRIGFNPLYCMIPDKIPKNTIPKNKFHE